MRTERVAGRARWSKENRGLSEAMAPESTKKIEKTEKRNDKRKNRGFQSSARVRMAPEEASCARNCVDRRGLLGGVKLGSMSFLSFKCARA